MPKTVSKRKASSAHRKVRTATSRSRKSTKRPSAAYKKTASSSKKQITSSKQASKQSQMQSEMMQKNQMQKDQQMQSEMMQKDQKSVKVKFRSEPEKSKAEIILGPVQILPDLEQMVDSMQPQKDQQMQSEMMQKDQTTQSEMMQKDQQMQSTIMSRVNEKIEQRKMSEMSQPKMPANEIKEQEIKKAIQNTKRIESRKRIKRSRSLHFGLKRVLLTFACTAAAVFAIVYFVNLNTTDVSIKVAAIQSGIDASYPNYVPRDYTLSDIISENGKITLNFRNTKENGAFTIIEEKSSWDSNTLLNNYVKEAYGNEYTVIREQGLTLYVGDSAACWVNGGVIYKLNITANTLTKKQIKSIATSL